MAAPAPPAAAAGHRRLPDSVRLPRQPRPRRLAPRRAAGGRRGGARLPQVRRRRVEDVLAAGREGRGEAGLARQRPRGAGVPAGRHRRRRRGRDGAGAEHAVAHDAGARAGAEGLDLRQREAGWHARRREQPRSATTSRSPRTCFMPATTACGCSSRAPPTSRAASARRRRSSRSRSVPRRSVRCRPSSAIAEAREVTVGGVARRALVPGGHGSRISYYVQLPAGAHLALGVGGEGQRAAERRWCAWPSTASRRARCTKGPIGARWDDLLLDCGAAAGPRGAHRFRRHAVAAVAWAEPRVVVKAPPRAALPEAAAALRPHLRLDGRHVPRRQDARATTPRRAC